MLLILLNQQSIADHILHDSTEYDKQSSYKRDTEPVCMHAIIVAVTMYLDFKCISNFSFLLEISGTWS